jgi:hypothetical protein
MAKNDGDSLIGTFLVGLLSAEATSAFRLLATLDYPIPDVRTFREQLKRHGANDETTRSLSSLFEPEDFGMDTTQSAFEKFSNRARDLSLPGVPLPRASLQVLADVVSVGGIIVKDNAVVFRSRGAVQVDCDCTDSVGNKGSGSCNIIVQGNILICSAGTCTGSCTLTTTIPTSNFFSLRDSGTVIF